jgi:hypothetical protein
MYKNIGVYRPFENQGQLADYLGVRPATVSSWINKDSCISAFMFFRMLIGFTRKGKRLIEVFQDFLDIVES